jgi:hypothetical protein
MPNERRQRERVPVYIPAVWKSGSAKDEGTILNLSPTGCFVATNANVKRGESIALEIHLPSVLRMELRGMIIHQLTGKGFAARFKDLTATERSLLERLIKLVKSNASDLRPPPVEGGC